MKATEARNKVLGPVVLVLALVSLFNVVQENTNARRNVERLGDVVDCFSAYNKARDEAAQIRVELSDKETEANKTLLLAFSKLAESPPKSRVEADRESRALLIQYGKTMQKIVHDRKQTPLPVYPDCASIGR